MGSWANTRCNFKLLAPIVVSVLVLGLVGSAQDVSATKAPTSDIIIWTGEGGDTSWSNPQNWRDFPDQNHRTPDGNDLVYIDDRCNDPFLPQFLVNNAVVDLDTGYHNDGTIVICDDDTLVVSTEAGDSGFAILENHSGDSIENSGTLIIDGLLINLPGGVINNNGGEIIVNGELRNNNGADINNNDGVITNNNVINNNNNGFINNNDGGIINNNDDLNNNDNALINNNDGGIINNNSYMYNEARITNHDGGIINNEDTIDNDGGIIRNVGTINNKDTIDNGGDLLNNDGGVINNDDEITNDEGFFRNRGIINNNDGAEIHNDDEFNNNPKGTINNNDGALITNHDEFNNGGTINNNEGAVIDNDEATITNNTPDGLIINAGTIHNPDDLTIDNFDTIINLCNGVITGVQPNDIDDGVTHNRSCNGILYSIDKSNPPILREIDPTNAATFSEIDISLVGFDPDEIKGGAGLATNPLTGELFALLKLDSDDDEEDSPRERTLVTIDPETGVATLLGSTGNTGDAFAGIAFDSSGNLFGVTGDGADVDETLFSLSKTDGTATELCELGNGSDGEALAFNFANGILYHGSGDDVFETIDSTSGEDCDVTDIGLDDDLNGEFTALTFDEDKGLFFAADFDDLLTISPNPGEIIEIGEMDEDSKGLAFVPFGEISIPLPSTGNGGLTYPDPNLGDPKHGQGHPNGFCMDQTCMDVTGLFNHWDETTVNQGSTHSFTLTIACPRGANTCDHIALAGALPDADFYDDQWTVSLDKQPMSDQWDITVMNDYGEINADGVTATVQTVGQTMITSTINVPFVLPGSIGTADGVDATHENNRHLHVTVHDSHGGSSNYIFNEGMYVQDIYAYPQIEMSFDSALEYEPLCLNEDSTKRHTCAFDKVKDWTIKNAEEKLKEMYGQRGQDMDSYDESEQY